MAHTTPSLKANLLTSASYNIVTAVSAIVAILAIAHDADDAYFPENEMVVVSNYREAIAAAGMAGTLKNVLTDFAAISAPKCIVIRVPSTDTTPPTDEELSTAADILLNCQQTFSYTPDYIGAPGLESVVLLNKLELLADKLDAPSYALIPAETLANAKTLWASLTGTGKTKGFWPDFVGYKGRAAAIALAMRALITSGGNSEYGPHQTISNYPLPLVTGLTHQVSWQADGTSGDVKDLNEAGITSMVNFDGAWRFWGDEMRQGAGGAIFENVLLVDLLAKKTLQKLELKNVSRTLTRSHVKNVLEEARAQYRIWQNKDHEWITGFSVDFLEDENSTDELTSGQWTLSIEHSVPRPGSHGVMNIRSTNKYLAGFAKSLAA